MMSETINSIISISDTEQDMRDSQDEQHSEFVNDMLTIEEEFRHTSFQPPGDLDSLEYQVRKLGLDYMNQELANSSVSYRMGNAFTTLTDQQLCCVHNWIHKEGSIAAQCFKCKQYPGMEKRVKCALCYIEACTYCYPLPVGKDKTQELLEIKSQRNRVRNLEERLDVLEMISQSFKDLLEPFIENTNDSLRNLTERLSIVENRKAKEYQASSSQQDKAKDSDDLSIPTELDLVDIGEGPKTEDTPLYITCNTDDLNSIYVSCRIHCKQHTIECIGLIDTGCTALIINEKLCPKDIIKPATSIRTKFFASEIYVKEFSYDIDFVLGLKFFLQDHGAITISRNTFCISKKFVQAPIISNYTASELRGKRGGNPLQQKPQPTKTCNCRVPGQCSKGKTDMCKVCMEGNTAGKKGKPPDKPPDILFTHAQFSTGEQLYLFEKDYLGNNFYLDHTDHIGNDIVPNKQLTPYPGLNKFILDLQTEGIISDSNPVKHWDRNRITCKLEILNPGYNIVTQPIMATPNDLKEFEVHISE
ncbi:hypothetical protein F0562_010404 [Nyssa sinensis]|uniref:Retropepsins domain-containing protein n=1 Tax=Nyssa sinensis TaxID=561372 RepID=A0A5J4ZZB9_9ASTE|nr:hypothetical protein F0562_010404 [Nyssa sinensis]